MSKRKQNASPTPALQAKPKGNETSVTVLDAGQYPEADEVLFYRHVPHMESLVFAPPDLAENVSEIHKAFAAKTWGEFQSLMPEEAFWQLMGSGCENDWGELFVIPQADDPFDLESICPAYFDGDYPHWLQKDQDLWLPKEILECWGKIESSVHNGTFWIINPKQEKKIVLRLRKLGILAQRRDDLHFY